MTQTKRAVLFDIMDKEQSAPSVTDESFHGKRVEVKGRLFPNDAILVVSEARAL